ncbi:predicted protein [Uncinocarpus reesii 1704]|uniref:Uncharacterized protein n=1 Tax=Uncinocarpus reesii (strain UAMH 1704) TaxID=336963 RepID=C4JWS4_UNCRE|nr:uncharacterized protein UREG_06097 [Uncinocarpus reesii 1704]EEP81232.1 predicted protein [Uncinocarpus reesii 1704]
MPTADDQTSLDEDETESAGAQDLDPRINTLGGKDVSVSIVSTELARTESLSEVGDSGNVSINRLSKSSVKSEAEQVLVLTPNGLELLSGSPPVSELGERAGDVHSRDFALSKPPSLSSPDSIIARETEEQIISRKSSFELAGVRDAELRVSERCGGYPALSDPELLRNPHHQLSSIKVAVRHANKTSLDSSSTRSTNVTTVSHARYLSVPTTHPAHQRFSTTKTANELNDYATPDVVQTQYQRNKLPFFQTPGVDGAPSNDSQSTSPNAPKVSTVQQTKTAGLATRLPGVDEGSLPLSVQRPRSRLSTFLSRFGSTHSKVTHSPPAQIQQQSGIPDRPVENKPLEGGSKRGPQHNISTGGTVDGGNPADSEVMKAKKGLKFLSRRSYNVHTEPPKKSTSLGIKTADQLPKPQRLALQARPPLPRVATMSPAQNNPGNVNSANTRRFYRSLNTQLSNIIDHPVSGTGVNPPSKTSLQTRLSHNRNISQPATTARYSVGGHPARSEFSAYSVGSQPEYFKAHSQGISTFIPGFPFQSPHLFVEQTKQQTGQPRGLQALQAPSIHQGAMTKPTSLVRQAALATEFSESTLSESRGPQTLQHGAGLPPPRPPPKIPLDYAYPSLAAPTSIRITSASGRQHQEGAGSLGSTPALHTTDFFQPRQPLLAREEAHNGPVELPTHDDSSEEVVMSSVSYPGQEWQPSSFGNWD